MKAISNTKLAQAIAVALGLGLFTGASAVPMVGVGGNVNAGSTTSGTALVDENVSPAIADILEIASDMSGNEAFIHPYATTGGLIGTRASGFGTFNAFGTSSITDVVMNTATFAQDLSFDFFINTGEVAADLGDGLVQLLGAVFMANIAVTIGGGPETTVFSTEARVELGMGGSLMATTNGDDVNYNTAATMDRITFGNFGHTLDLGTLTAGQSATIVYTMSAFAIGSSDLSTCGFGGPGIELADHLGGDGEPVIDDSDPPIENTCPSAIARSGDPNGPVLMGMQPIGGQPGTPGGGPGLSPTQTGPVGAPEPLTLALVGTGLIGFGVAQKRKRQRG